MLQVLEGIRVVDLSRIFAGPDAAQMLGDLGADVVKIEERGGDGSRMLGVSDPANPGYSASYQSFNRNKRGMTLDLKTDEGRRVAACLLGKADVVINNFRKGTMERWGLDYDTLSAENPGLVYGELHAFGDKGPMAHQGANDLQLQAHSGLMSITGAQNGEPSRAGSAIIDLHASTALVAGILAALLQRVKTGKGQRVQTSLLHSSAHLMGYLYQEYWVTGYVHRAMGTAIHLSVPNQAFPTKDGHVIIIAPTDAMWERCVTALEAPHLLDPPFGSAADRLANRDLLVEKLSHITSRLSSSRISELLSAAKVNVAIVHDIAEAADHEQLDAVGGLFHAADETGPRRFVAPPFTLSAAPARMMRPAPKLGEHNEEILSEAGYRADEIVRLRQEGVI